MANFNFFQLISRRKDVPFFGLVSDVISKVIGASVDEKRSAIRFCQHTLACPKVKYFTLNIVVGWLEEKLVYKCRIKCCHIKSAVCCGLPELPY